MTDTLDRKALSLRRLADMLRFAVGCFGLEFVQQAVAQMAWVHNLLMNMRKKRQMQAAYSGINHGLFCKPYGLAFYEVCV